MKRVPVYLILAAALVITAVVPAATAPFAPAAGAGELKTFASEEELAGYIRENTEFISQLDFWEAAFNQAAAVPEGPAGQPRTAEKQAAPGAAAAAPGVKTPPDFSTTNVQVEGVDEGDSVKTDGRHIYAISGDGKTVTVVEAHPPEKARIVSEINLTGAAAGVENSGSESAGGGEGGGTPGPPFLFAREIYVHGNRLAVLGSRVDYAAGGRPETFLKVYDLSKKEEPALKKDAAVSGDLVASRMIGDYLYAVVSAPVTWLNAAPAPEQGKGAPGAPGPAAANPVPDLPRITFANEVKTILPNEIHYFDYPDRAYCYTTVISLNTQDDGEPPKRKTLLTGASQNIYASAQNIYLTGAKTPDMRALAGKFADELAALAPPQLRFKVDEVKNSTMTVAEKIKELQALFEDCLFSLEEEEAGALAEKISAALTRWHQELARERDKTIIRKLALNGGEINYLCSGEVPGTVLNQFSMDEYRGYFRIATTSRGVLFPALANTRNNIYVLDENLKITGRLQGLAPTETIYAARFAGDRAYLVTFRRIDPFFVIDLKDPQQPKLLGELKMPGYSEYLHPLDENHLLGIGREIPGNDALPASREPEALIWPPPPAEQGIKISLFDVSDPLRPKEKAKYVIPGANAWSPALTDHKAVLISRAKGLLVIPVTLGPVYRIMFTDQPVPPSPERGIAAPEKMPYYLPWQGFYVFNLTSEYGIELKGKITHTPGGYSPDAPEEQAGQAKRALYIEETLYTLSDLLIKMNRLADLKEINRLRLK